MMFLNAPAARALVKHLATVPAWRTLDEIRLELLRRGFLDVRLSSPAADRALLGRILGDHVTDPDPSLRGMVLCLPPSPLRPAPVYRVVSPDWTELDYALVLAQYAEALALAMRTP
jgi:hypothetical protein